MNSEFNIRDEEILLLGLCRLEFSEEQLKKIRSLTGVITDWDNFSILANLHGVGALISHNLEKHKLLAGIPEDLVVFLRGVLVKSQKRNAFNTGSIAEVLSLLNNKQIKTVLLKGLALELSVYGNTGLRQMSDVDILVSRQQCIEAREILLNNGYISNPVKSFFHKFILADLGKHLPLLIKNETSVEIHHELFGPRNVLTQMLYESSYEFDLKGEKAYIPQPQIFFLYLVKHLWLHERNNESQLRLYTDLVVLIEKYRNEIINFELLRYASEAGMSEILAWRLAPLRDLWGVSFPDWIDDFIDKWYKPESINKFIFFLKYPKENPVRDNARFYRHVVSDIPGLHRKILFLLGDLLPSVSFMKKRYKIGSTWKVILYYPHRLGKLWWLIGKWHNG